MLQIHLERPLYEHETLNQNYDYEKPKSSCKLWCWGTHIPCYKQIVNTSVCSDTQYDKRY